MPPLTQRSLWVRKGREGSEPVDHSLDPVAHLRDVKVHQISELEPTQSQVAQELASMHGQYRFDRFEFDGNAIIDHKVDAKSVLNVKSLSARRAAPVSEWSDFGMTIHVPD